MIHIPLYPAEQVLRGIATSITATLPDATGEPVAGLTVTVTITDANGTAVATDAACTDAGSGVYTKSLTAAQLASLGVLTAAWKVATVTRATTTHEIVSGFYASLLDIKAHDDNINQIGADDATVRRIRGSVEATFEHICGVAFLPRYRRAVLDGTGRSWLLLPDPLVQTIRSVTIRTTNTSTTTALTAGQLTELVVDDGVLSYINGSTRFTAGSGNVVVEYEHGYPGGRVPAEVRDAAIAYMRERLQRPRSGIPDRAVTFAVAEGGTYRLALPSGSRTGNPDIDAILERHTWRRSVGAMVG